MATYGTLSGTYRVGTSGQNWTNGSRKSFSFAPGVACTIIKVEIKPNNCSTSGTRKMTIAVGSTDFGTTGNMKSGTTYSLSDGTATTGGSGINIFFTPTISGAGKITGYVYYRITYVVTPPDPTFIYPSSKTQSSCPLQQPRIGMQGVNSDSEVTLTYQYYVRDVTAGTDLFGWTNVATNVSSNAAKYAQINQALTAGHQYTYYIRTYNGYRYSDTVSKTITCSQSPLIEEGQPLRYENQALIYEGVTEDTPYAVYGTYVYIDPTTYLPVTATGWYVPAQKGMQFYQDLIDEARNWYNISSYTWPTPSTDVNPSTNHGRQAKATFWDTHVTALSSLPYRAGTQLRAPSVGQKITVSDSNLDTLARLINELRWS